MQADSSFLYLPRRHRRRQLFPPGLLALAGLLWLGCVALRPWHEELRPKRITQLTMPNLGYASARDSSISFRIPSPDSAQKLRLWRDAYFSGSEQTDKEQQTRVLAAVIAMKADTIQAGGVRVRFAPEVRYEQMVFLISLMKDVNHKKYWFDIQSSPTTFYAITDAYNPHVDRTRYECLLCNCVFTPSYTPVTNPFWVRFDNQVVAFWQFDWLHPLFQPEWRPVMWLLSAIAILSIWRIVRRP